ncbi:MAG: hypothetical protein HOD92_01935 [Deltaproteobacteria bacterium]|nr:hypothetical protein [Deltaproteobacteria bacterium]
MGNATDEKAILPPPDVTLLNYAESSGWKGTGRSINYCGKHVLFGEMISTVVSKSIESSLKGAVKNNLIKKSESQNC